MLPFPTHCPACQNRLAECRTSAAAAIIVDLAGIVEKQHVQLRCRRPSCPDVGVLYWHNRSVREGRHVFHGKLPGFRCFMPSSVFGFSVPWLQQFHARLVRQHASFTAKRVCSLRRLPTYVCSSAKVGLHGAFSQGHWGQIWTFGRHGGPFLAAVATHIWTEYFAGSTRSRHALRCGGPRWQHQESEGCVCSSFGRFLPV